MNILLAINEEDNKILHTVSRELSVDEILSDKIENLAAEMKNYVMTNKKCKGLAAPQVGHNIRLFVLKHGKSSRTYINPEIIQKSRKVMSDERCLSCGDEVGTKERFTKIVVKFHALYRADVMIDDLKNDDAIAYQHELDHLEGKLIID